jgi:hypothetical protein
MVNCWRRFTPLVVKTEAQNERLLQRIETLITLGQFFGISPAPFVFPTDK